MSMTNRVLKNPGGSALDVQARKPLVSERLARITRNMGWVLLLATGWAACFGAGLPTQAWAAEERGGELSGEPEPSKTQAEAPGLVTQEPEATVPSKGDNARPSLKMPDVVVKGDRQFQVTAERKEWLMLDPMAGTKEIPSDLASVAIPGLDTQKGSPASQTLAAKNVLALLEAGAGTSNLREGRLVVGQEFDQLNYLLHGDYAGGDYPAAFGFLPSGQKAEAALDLRFNPAPATGLTLSLTGQGETQRQVKSPALWGDWLERGQTGVKAQGETAFGSQAGLQAGGEWDSFVQRGSPQVDGRAVMTGQAYAGEAAYEQRIGHVLNDGLSLWAQLKARGQHVSLTQANQVLDVVEGLKTLRLLSRFKVSTWLLMNFGVQMDDFQGQTSSSAAYFSGGLSFLLPTGSVLYGETRPGLAWKPVTDWMGEQPHPAAVQLPKPETVQTDCRAGWRQNWLGVVSSDLAWFRREARNTPVWTDQNTDGLFEYVALEQTRTEGVEAGVEVQYTPRLSQSVKYVFRQIRAGADGHVPYVPAREAQTELLYTRTPLELGVTYRYLGERFTVPGEGSPVLTPLHNLGVRADYELVPGWNVYARLDNLLSYTWEEWAGYPQRTFSALAGLRVTF